MSSALENLKASGTVRRSASMPRIVLGLAALPALQSSSAGTIWLTIDALLDGCL